MIKNIFDNAYDYVLKNNKSNDAPYHNLKHMVYVSNFCCEIAESLNVEKTNLVVAALFHDFDHSAGKEKDNVNIINAIKGFELYYNQLLNNNIKKSINKEKVINIIKCTEYPYVINDPDIFQMIIRDVDLLQSSTEDWYDFTIIGLAKEYNIDIETMIENSKEFRKNIKFYFPISEIIYTSNSIDVKKRLNL